MHIPGPYSLHDTILVVGEPDGVMRAVGYINRLVEKALEPKQSQEEIIAQEAAAAAAATVDEDALEPWMESYTAARATNEIRFNI